jgi:hypothetical protein
MGSAEAELYACLGEFTRAIRRLEPPKVQHQRLALLWHSSIKQRFPAEAADQVVLNGLGALLAECRKQFVGSELLVASALLAAQEEFWDKAVGERKAILLERYQLGEDLYKRLRITVVRSMAAFLADPLNVLPSHPPGIASWIPSEARPAVNRVLEALEILTVVSLSACTWTQDMRNKKLPNDVSGPVGIFQREVSRRGFLALIRLNSSATVIWEQMNTWGISRHQPFADPDWWKDIAPHEEDPSGGFTDYLLYIRAEFARRRLDDSQSQNRYLRDTTDDGYFHAFDTWHKMLWHFPGACLGLARRFVRARDAAEVLGSIAPAVLHRIQSEETKMARVMAMSYQIHDLQEEYRQPVVNPSIPLSAFVYSSQLLEALDTRSALTRRYDSYIMLDDPSDHVADPDNDRSQFTPELNI